MTTVAVPGSPGKYNVFFNGSSIPCFNDTDCPGAGICAINQTWAVTPGGFCMCFSRGGLEGEDCSSLCPLGNARIGIAAVVMALSFLASLLSLTALLSQMRSRRGWANIFNALNVTLLSIGMGSMFLIAYMIMVLVTTVGFPGSFVVLQDPTGRWLRRSSQQAEYATFILLVLAQCASACAPLLLPLIWSEMASSIFSMRTISIRAVHTISVGFCAVVLFVQVPLYVLAANNFQGNIFYYGEIAADIWYVVYGFILLVNLFAAGKIFFATEEIKRRPASEINDRFVHLLQRVFKAAVMLVILMSCMIGLIIGSQARQSRTYYNDPTCNVVGGSVYTLSDLCLRLALMIMILTSLTCLWFIFPDVIRLISMSSAPIEVDMDIPRTDGRVDIRLHNYDMSHKGVTDSHPVTNPLSSSKNEIMVI